MAMAPTVAVLFTGSTRLAYKALLLQAYLALAA